MSGTVVAILDYRIGKAWLKNTVNNKGIQRTTVIDSQPKILNPKTVTFKFQSLAEPNVN